MSVTVSDHRSLEHADQQETDIDPDDLCDILNAVHQALDLPAGDIEFNLVDDATIAGLNREYRGNNAPTNVLSFPHYNWVDPGTCMDDLPEPGPDSPPVLWGEIFVSPDTIRRQMSPDTDSFLLETVRIGIHGMLHLFGYDHETDEQYSVMLPMEQLGFDFAIRWLEQKET